MRIRIIFALVVLFGCQSQNNSKNKTEKSAKGSQHTEIIASKTSNTQQEQLQCNEEICLQLRNHDVSKKSFDIFMANSVPIAGFQCNLPGINISGSGGGLLEENGYQTSNSTFRILSFSMQATLIPIGEGILTTIYYSDPTKVVCMNEIIFAGIGGAKLSNNLPECMKLN